MLDRPDLHQPMVFGWSVFATRSCQSLGRWSAEKQDANKVVSESQSMTAGKLRPRQTEEGVEAAEPSLIVEGAENGSEVTATKRKRRAKVENTQPILGRHNGSPLDLDPLLLWS